MVLVLAYLLNNNPQFIHVNPSTSFSGLIKFNTSNLSKCSVKGNCINIPSTCIHHSIHVIILLNLVGKFLHLAYNQTF